MDKYDIMQMIEQDVRADIHGDLYGHERVAEQIADYIAGLHQRLTEMGWEVDRLRTVGPSDAERDGWL